MSTQQDIYAAGSEKRPPMLNKDNYVPWSSRLLRYSKSKPNGKLIYNSIMNGPYVRRMIPKPGDPDREVSIAETFHEQTGDELTKKEVKQMEVDDQSIQIILMGIPEDIYAAVDSCETAQEIWLRVRQMMKGSDIGIQDKKAKLFNEWEMFTSMDGESIESYYHCFSKLMNDFKRNKHFPEKIASNLKFLNNLQPEWRRHVTIFHQTKDLHEVDYTQLYDFLKYNQAKIAQPGMNLGQDRQMQMVGGNRGNQFRQYVGQNVGNQNGYNAIQTVENQNLNPNGNGNVVAARVEGNAIGNNGIQIRCYNYRGLGHLARNCTDIPRRRDAAYLQTQLLIAQKEEAGIQLQVEEFDLMAAAGDLDEIEEIDKAPVYDSDGSVEVQLSDNCNNNDIFNMFTQEEKYTELLEPIRDPHQVQQNDSNVISEVPSVEQGGETVEQHSATIEETLTSFYHNEQKMALGYQNPFYLKQAQRKQHSLYNGKVLLEKHDSPVVYDSEETLQLAQESRLKMIQLNKEIKPENYAKIDHHSRVFVSQTAKSREEKYFSNTSKTANVSKSISIPNEEFSDVTTPSVARKFLNEVKSTIVTLQRVVKQKMTLDIHNWSSSVHQEIHKIVKDEIFPIVNQVDARVQNFKIQFLKEAAKFVRDFKSLANEADEYLAKHKALKFEIDRLLRAIVSQDIMSIVQNPTVFEAFNLQTELEHTKERFENCIFKKDNEYAKLWNEWYKKCKEIDNTAKTRRPHPRSNTKNDRVPSASKSSCNKNKEVEVEVHFFRSKDEAPEEIKTFLKKITVLLQAPVIMRLLLRAKLKTAPSFTVDLTKHHASSLTAENQTSHFYMYSGLSVILRMIVKTLGNLVQKVTLIFFIGFSANSCAYRVYNRRTKKIMETMNVTFDELSAMAFEQRSLKPRLQSMTSRQISSGLNLTYAPSTITTQQPTEHELNLLFEAMYDDYIGGQPSTATRTAPAAQAP
ncbi:hypothetical protein Tco_1400838 [Tanacetum coccineum]